MYKDAGGSERLCQREPAADPLTRCPAEILGSFARSACLLGCSEHLDRGNSISQEQEECRRHQLARTSQLALCELGLEKGSVNAAILGGNWHCWTPALWAALIPRRLLGMLAVTSFFVFKYYVEHCASWRPWPWPWPCHGSSNKEPRFTSMMGVGFPAPQIAEREQRLSCELIGRC